MQFNWPDRTGFQRMAAEVLDSFCFVKGSVKRIKACMYTILLTDDGRDNHFFCQKQINGQDLGQEFSLVVNQSLSSMTQWLTFKFLFFYSIQGHSSIFMFYYYSFFFLFVLFWFFSLINLFPFSPPNEPRLSLLLIRMDEVRSRQNYKENLEAARCWPASTQLPLDCVVYPSFPHEEYHFSPFLTPHFDMLHDRSK